MFSDTKPVYSAFGLGKSKSSIDFGGSGGGAARVSQGSASKNEAHHDDLVDKLLDDIEETKGIESTKLKSGDKRENSIGSGGSRSGNNN